MNKEMYNRIKQAQKEMKGMELRCLTRLCIVTDKITQHMGATNCAGSLNFYEVVENNPLKNSDSMYIISAIMHCSADAEDKAKVAYVDWLVKRSPYSSSFTSKNVSRIFKDGFTIHNADTPSNIMLGGIMSIRALWEYDNIYKGWYELVTRGCNENLAFILGVCCSFSDEDKSITFKLGGNDHISINTNYISKDYIRHFVNNTPVRLLKTYKESLNYGSVNATWGYGGVSEYLKDKLGDIKYYNNRFKNNVFYKAAPEHEDVIDIDNGFNQLLQISKAIMKDLK